MPFAADQSVRVECVGERCLEIAFDDTIPSAWSRVESIKDKVYTHRGLCPRCTRKAAGISEPQELPFVPVVAKNCGNCAHWAANEAGCLPGFRKCMHRKSVAGATIYHPRSQSHHGAACRWYMERREPGEEAE